MVNAGANAPAGDYHLRAWPLIWGTLLTTGLAVVFGLVFALLASIFIVEFAPDRLRAVIVPVVRLLAAVPSVIFGLIGDPRAGAVRGQPHHLAERQGVGRVRRPAQRRQPAGRGRGPHRDDRPDHDRHHRRRAATPSRAGGRRAPSRSASTAGARCGRSASARRGRRSSPPPCSPAPARWARRSCCRWSRARCGFSPNPFDGPRLFLLEPLRPLASTIVEDAESMQAPAVRSTIYAFALLLLFSSLFLSRGRLPGQAAR